MPIRIISRDERFEKVIEDSTIVLRRLDGDTAEKLQKQHTKIQYKHGNRFEITDNRGLTVAILDHCIIDWRDFEGRDKDGNIIDDLPRSYEAIRMLPGEVIDPIIEAVGAAHLLGDGQEEDDPKNSKASSATSVAGE